MGVAIADFEKSNDIECTFLEKNARCIMFSSSRLDRAKEKKRKSLDTEKGEPKRIFTRSCVEDENQCGKTTEDGMGRVCFLCSNPETNEKLHEVTTFSADCRVREAAQVLQHEKLIAYLSTGDLVALEAKYHLSCLVSLYNQARTKRSNSPTEDFDDQMCKGVALAELISYMEDQRKEESVKIFRLADLAKLYTKRLLQLGVDSSRINSTHLKNRLLAHMPDMRAYNEGRDVYLSSNDDVASVLRQGYEADRDEMSIMMTKIAQTIRNDVFQQTVTFTGSFDQNSQVKSVPKSLLSFVSMLINGSNITEQTQDRNLSQPVLTIAQLLVFNSLKRRRENVKTPKVYHTKEREMPLPVYLGLKIHALNRDRQLIDSLYTLGLSVSYDRTMDIVTSLGNNVCEYYQSIGTVCPPQIQNGLFVTAAADNIDHNPSSATSTSSFHGTSLSLFQNMPGSNDLDHNKDVGRGFTHSVTPVSGVRKIADLPQLYTEIRPTALSTTDVYVPKSRGSTISSCDRADEEMLKEEDWLVKVHEALDGDDIPPGSQISWAAYHASLLPEPNISPSINAMLPLFIEEASSPSMLRHAFDVIEAAVHHVNPGQVPVISVDQPLYAKMKQLQWSMGHLYGEDKFVLLLGGLHTEMTAFKALGHWLEGSGWVEALHDSEVATPGVAESFLKASHVTRTRHAHQVTACALYILLQKAYNDRQNGDLQTSLAEWCVQQTSKTPQFLFWITCLELELLVFEFVRSLRTGDFGLYVASLTKLTPWFFSLNHTHYSRWMPVHIRDMINLEKIHPNVAQEFRNGKFVMSKSKRKFSLIAIDHGHEQNNGFMKAEGGIIGLTQDDDALLRWAVAGPELIRVIHEFETSMIGKSETTSTNHHEATHATQDRFAKQVKSLVEVIDNFGNPFEEEGQELVRLHTRDIMGQDSTECVKDIEQQGADQYQAFVRERLETQLKPITAPIQRNNVAIFHEKVKKEKKSGETVNLLKEESSLFSRLYVSCQNRDGDLDNFFSHENHPFPPSISSLGHLRFGNKSDLMACLEKEAGATCIIRPPTEVTILDGAAIVNMLQPRGCKTFREYASTVFIPYVQREQNLSQRVDLVWDQYVVNSLKSQTREQREHGPCLKRRVELNAPVPKNWQHFLRVDNNKIELFKLLNAELVNASTGQLVLTNGDGVMAKYEIEDSNLAPCNHEEADSRMMVHVADAVRQGFSKILIRTVDTDVMVLAVSTVQSLGELQLWIAFGTKKNLRYIPAHEVSRSLGPRKSLALPVFHAMTGCDTVSHFAKVGKRTAWNVWKANDQFTETFYAVHDSPEAISEEVFEGLEYFTILLYDKTTTCTSINKVRKQMFTLKGRQMSSLPPTQAVLRQHIKRAVLQAGHYWGKLTIPNPHFPSPGDWGWTCPEEWKPLWSTLPEASVSCPELIKCRCRSKCVDCKCTKAVLKCTVYCTCKGECDNV